MKKIRGMSAVRSLPSRTAIAAATLGLFLLAGPPAHAGVNDATLRGTVTSQSSVAALAVFAKNTANGFTYQAVTDAEGRYAFAALPAGTYQIRVGTEAGSADQTVTLSVGEAGAVDLSLVSMGTIQIIGSAVRQDVRTSEVGTNVTPLQMENLPQVTRNFLSFADLAPGVRFDVTPTTGYYKVQSGAQNQDNINVFVDGMSQKGDVLRGGMAGQDSSRGNPFPQSAISEYRIVTQNYKAEYDQVSSVAISAQTKSGTNEVHGDAFVDRTGGNLTALDPFQEAAQKAGVPRPEYKQLQYGVSIGGPIVLDRIHYFFTYEGKNIDTPRQVIAQNANILPNAGLVPGLLAQQGGYRQTFREKLAFGKIDMQINPDQRLEFTMRVRRENDLTPEDTLLSVPNNTKSRENNETRANLRHEWTRGSWFNEAQLGYQNVTWNPHSTSGSPLNKFFISPSNATNNTLAILDTGGSPDAQNRGQRGSTIQDALTFTGMPGHEFKGGARLNILTFDMSGTANSVPTYSYLLDNVTGLPIGGTNPGDPFQVTNAIAPMSTVYKDNQVGLFFQDDWDVTRQLQVNLGVRWDYETNMLDDNYVTPADRVAIFGAQDPRTGAPAGQTYAQSLALGGVNIGDFLSTGSSRKAFMGAFQPRVGASFDFFGDKSSVLFGGLGRAYDRAIANAAMDEHQKNAQPGGEIWLIRNDHKMPFTDQFSFGLRQAIGEWNAEVGYTNSRSHNQFNWYGGNRDPKGGWCNDVIANACQSPIDPLWGSVPGFGTLILGDFVTEAKTQVTYLKAERPFTKASHWGAGVTYTMSDAMTTNRQWTNDIFNWTFGKYISTWNPSVDVEKERIVATGMTDLLPWDVMLSGRATFGSGFPYQITECSKGWDKCTFQQGNGNGSKQIDLSLSKNFGVGFGGLTVRLDVINVLNQIQYSGYDSWGGGPGNPQNFWGGDNAHTGVPGSVGQPMRTYKLGLRYAF